MHHVNMVSSARPRWETCLEMPEWPTLEVPLGAYSISRWTLMLIVELLPGEIHSSTVRSLLFFISSASGWSPRTYRWQKRGRFRWPRS